MVTKVTRENRVVEVLGNGNISRSDREYLITDGRGTVCGDCNTTVVHYYYLRCHAALPSDFSRRGSPKSDIFCNRPTQSTSS